MKATLTVSTHRGFYAEKSAKVSNVKEAQTWAMGQLDKLPDEVDGELLMDWTRLDLVITKGG